MDYGLWTMDCCSNGLYLLEQPRQIRKAQHIRTVDRRMIRILVHLQEDAVTKAGRHCRADQGRDELALAAGGIAQPTRQLY